LAKFQFFYSPNRKGAGNRAFEPGLHLATAEKRAFFATAVLPYIYKDCISGKE
jgi:hypothetical protein